MTVLQRPVFCREGLIAPGAEARHDGYNSKIIGTATTTMIASSGRPMLPMTTGAMSTAMALLSGKNLPYVYRLTDDLARQFGNSGGLAMRWLSAGAVFGSLCLLPCPLSGQEVGDPGAGLAVAEEVCAQCHSVLPGQGYFLKPDPLPFEDSVPLPFEDIANTPGITEMALLAWMTSSHPTMPDIMLETEELRDVVAYILNLRNR